jgi:hypothetical protein
VELGDIEHQSGGKAESTYPFNYRWTARTEWRVNRRDRRDQCD